MIGGDCTIELGTVLGWQRQRDATRLVYVDPHPDLNTRPRCPTVRWTGWAWRTCSGSPAHVRSSTDLGRLRPDDVLLFGYSAARATVAERDAIADHGIDAIAQDEVAGEGAARAWSGRGRPFLLHFDTDSIDFADLPLAENTDRNVGLSFDTVAGAVDGAVRRRARRLTVTEINPHHGEPDGATLRRSSTASSRR